MTTLHYIFDPLCGWCYGAAPLLTAARALTSLRIALHGGGMLSGTNRRPISAQWRDYVMPHDRRIAQLSGQPFGAAYFDGLLRDEGAVLDSAPPTRAILAADALAGRGLEMLHAIQRAHYVHGRRVADPAVLAALALELGLDPAAFAAAFARLDGEATACHFADSRAWLARCGGSGFPTLALEHADGTLAPLEPAAWLGRAAAWQDFLRTQIARSGPLPGASGALCQPDGCAG